jgi:tripartite-type tricarboxylate transporter receptor subunit TctC
MLARSAVLNDKRSSLLPDIPTIAEQGIPEYNYASWFDIIARFVQDGSSMVGNTPQQFRQVIATESERWRKLVQDTGITVDD